MKQLPPWVMTNPTQAFYDTESGTAIQQTAKVYGAMNELISEWEEFKNNLTNTVENIISTQNADYEQFKLAIRQEFQDFINVVDLKILSIEQRVEVVENKTINLTYDETAEHLYLG